jgi:D-amino-acid dehydrogenase
VQFRFGVQSPSSRSAGQISGVKLAGEAGETLTADRYVLALGSYSRRCSPAGAGLPVYPVKGYSLTVPLVDEARAALDRDGRDLQGGHHPL